MDCRTLLIRFPTAANASAAADELAAAMAEHVVYLRQHEGHGWGRTPPLEAFAARVGFSWAEDDDFVIDGLPEDLQLVIGTLGRLLVVSHAACRSIGAYGLTAFGQRRGATHATFWDPDAPSSTLVIRSATSVEPAFDALRDEAGLEGEWVERADGEPGRLVLNEKVFLAHGGWGLAVVLLRLGELPSIDADLVNGTPLEPR